MMSASQAASHGNYHQQRATEETYNAASRSQHPTDASQLRKPDLPSGLRPVTGGRSGEKECVHEEPYVIYEKFARGAGFDSRVTRIPDRQKILNTRNTYRLVIKRLAREKWLGFKAQDLAELATSYLRNVFMRTLFGGVPLPPKEEDGFKLTFVSEPHGSDPLLWHTWDGRDESFSSFLWSKLLAYPTCGLNEWIVFRQFGKIYVRDGRDISLTLPWKIEVANPGTSSPTKEELNTIHRGLDVLDQFFPDERQTTKTLWAGVPRFGSEDWIEIPKFWRKRAFYNNEDGHRNRLAFYRDFLWKIDDPYINIYPAGWNPGALTYEQWQHALTKYRHSNPQATIHETQIAAGSASLHRHRQEPSANSVPSSPSANTSRDVYPKEQRSRKCKANLCNADLELLDAQEQQSHRQMHTHHVTICHLDSRCNARMSFMNYSERARHRSMHQRKLQMTPRERSVSLVDQVLEDVDTYVSCPYHQLCNARLRAMTPEERQRHVLMHTRERCRAHAACRAPLALMTDDQRGKHIEMHEGAQDPVFDVISTTERQASASVDLQMPYDKSSNLTPPKPQLSHSHPKSSAGSSKGTIFEVTEVNGGSDTNGQQKQAQETHHEVEGDESRSGHDQTADNLDDGLDQHADGPGEGDRNADDTADGGQDGSDDQQGDASGAGDGDSDQEGSEDDESQDQHEEEEGEEEDDDDEDEEAEIVSEDEEAQSEIEYRKTTFDLKANVENVVRFEEFGKGGEAVERILKVDFGEDPRCRLHELCRANLADIHENNSLDVKHHNRFHMKRICDKDSRCKARLDLMNHKLKYRHEEVMHKWIHDPTNWRYHKTRGLKHIHHPPDQWKKQADPEEVLESEDDFGYMDIEAPLAQRFRGPLSELLLAGRNLACMFHRNCKARYSRMPEEDQEAHKKMHTDNLCDRNQFCHAPLNELTKYEREQHMLMHERPFEARRSREPRSKRQSTGNIPPLEPLSSDTNEADDTKSASKERKSGASSTTDSGSDSESQSSSELSGQGTDADDNELDLCRIRKIAQEITNGKTSTILGLRSIQALLNGCIARVSKGIYEPRGETAERTGAVHDVLNQAPVQTGADKDSNTEEPRHDHEVAHSNDDDYAKETVQAAVDNVRANTDSPQAGEEDIIGNADDIQADSATHATDSDPLFAGTDEDTIQPLGEEGLHSEDSLDKEKVERQLRGEYVGEEDDCMRMPQGQGLIVKQLNPPLETKYFTKDNVNTPKILRKEFHRPEIPVIPDKELDHVQHPGLVFKQLTSATGNLDRVKRLTSALLQAIEQRAGDITTDPDTPVKSVESDYSAPPPALILPLHNLAMSQQRKRQTSGEVEPIPEPGLNASRQTSPRSESVRSAENQKGRKQRATREVPPIHGQNPDAPRETRARSGSAQPFNNRPTTSWTDPCNPSQETGARERETLDGKTDAGILDCSSRKAKLNYGPKAGSAVRPIDLTSNYNEQAGHTIDLTGEDNEQAGYRPGQAQHGGPLRLLGKGGSRRLSTLPEQTTPAGSPLPRNTAALADWKAEINKRKIGASGPNLRIKKPGKKQKSPQRTVPTSTETAHATTTQHVGSAQGAVISQSTVQPAGTKTMTDPAREAPKGTMGKTKLLLACHKCGKRKFELNTKRKDTQHMEACGIKKDDFSKIKFINDMPELTTVPETGIQQVAPAEQQQQSQGAIFTGSEGYKPQSPDLSEVHSKTPGSHGAASQDIELPTLAYEKQSAGQSATKNPEAQASGKSESSKVSNVTELENMFGSDDKIDGADEDTSTGQKRGRDTDSDSDDGDGEAAFTIVPDLTPPKSKRAKLDGDGEPVQADNNEQGGGQSCSPITDPAHDHGGAGRRRAKAKRCPTGTSSRRVEANASAVRLRSQTRQQVATVSKPSAQLSGGSRSSERIRKQQQQAAQAAPSQRPSSDNQPSTSPVSDDESEISYSEDDFTDEDKALVARNKKRRDRRAAKDKRRSERQANPARAQAVRVNLGEDDDHVAQNADSEEDEASASSEKGRQHGYGTQHNPPASTVAKSGAKTKSSVARRSSPEDSARPLQVLPPQVTRHQTRQQTAQDKTALLGSEAADSLDQVEGHYGPRASARRKKSERDIELHRAAQEGIARQKEREKREAEEAKKKEEEENEAWKAANRFEVTRLVKWTYAKGLKPEGDKFVKRMFDRDWNSDIGSPGLGAGFTFKEKWGATFDMQIRKEVQDAQQQGNEEALRFHTERHRRLLLVITDPAEWARLPGSTSGRVQTPTPLEQQGILASRDEWARQFEAEYFQIGKAQFEDDIKREVERAIKRTNNRATREEIAQAFAALEGTIERILSQGQSGLDELRGRYEQMRPASDIAKASRIGPAKAEKLRLAAQKKEEKAKEAAEKLQRKKEKEAERAENRKRKSDDEDGEAAARPAKKRK